MLMRYDPIREFERLTSSLFDTARTARNMPMDAYRQGDDLHVHLDLPGIDPDSIDLRAEGNVLSITARRAFDRTGLDELIVSERPQGVFSRQVFLGEGLDVDALEASYRDGVLSIRVPVHESAKPRRIPISVHGGRQEIGSGDDTTVERREAVGAGDAA